MRSPIGSGKAYDPSCDEGREDAGLDPPSELASDEEHQVELEPGRLLIHVSTDEGVTEEWLGLELERVED